MTNENVDQQKPAKPDVDPASTQPADAESPGDSATNPATNPKSDTLDESANSSALRIQTLVLKRQYIQCISIKLLVLLITVGVLLYFLLAPWVHLNKSQISSIPIVFLTGVVGGIVGIQRRLKTLVVEDLELLARSAPFLLLAPIIGGFLALLLFLMFIGELVQGDLFPTFSTSAAAAWGGNIKSSANSCIANGISALMCVSASASDYGKLLFWCFVAGFSERFVTGLMFGIEGKSVTGPLAQARKDEALHVVNSTKKK